MMTVLVRIACPPGLLVSPLQAFWSDAPLFPNATAIFFDSCCI
jgi:hypothetical protein